jgi:hypothetical protein
MPASALPCDLPDAGPAAAAADELDPPAGRAECPSGRLAVERGDPPAGERDAQAGASRERPQQQGRDSLGLGRELQPAALDQAEAVDLGERGDQARTVQGLLERPEADSLCARPDHEQPFRGEPELGQARAEQLVPRADPDRMTAGRQQPAEQRCGEAQGRGLARLAVKLVQRAPGQPAARQDAIDAGEPERPHPLGVRRRTVEPGELGAQPLEAPLVRARRFGIDRGRRRAHG